MAFVLASLSVSAYVLASLSASSERFEVDGIYYETLSDNEVSVTRGYTQYGDIEYSGDIVIPKAVQWNGKTYQVTELGPDAFYQCSKVTSVTLPNSIKVIGNSCFESRDGNSL